MSKIVETMVAAHKVAFDESCFDGGADHDADAMSAALRAVRPEDISDAMCKEAALVWTEGNTPSFRQLRRAIAAAIAAGGE